MKKNKSWKFTDESTVTFQSSVSGPGEFGLRLKILTGAPFAIQYRRGSGHFVTEMSRRSGLFVVYNVPIGHFRSKWDILGVKETF